jgi:hypothetical protein
MLGFVGFFGANEPRIMADFKLKINPIQEIVPINS